MKKSKVLFVCAHNSARSQMAEAFLKQLAGDRFDVESAGLEPGKINPVVVDVMKEAGIDLMTSLSGVSTETAFANKKHGVYGDIPVFFIDLKDFLSNKRATGRKKDEADIEALEK